MNSWEVESRLFFSSRSVGNCRIKLQKVFARFQSRTVTYILIVVKWKEFFWRKKKKLSCLFFDRPTTIKFSCTWRPHTLFVYNVSDRQLCLQHPKIKYRNFSSMGIFHCFNQPEASVSFSCFSALLSFIVINRVYKKTLTLSLL